MIVEGEGAVLGVNLRRPIPIVTNVVFATRLFPNYFGLDVTALLLCFAVFVCDGYAPLSRVA